MKHPLFFLFAGVFVSFLGFGAFFFNYTLAGAALIGFGTVLEVVGIARHKKTIDQHREE